MGAQPRAQREREHRTEHELPVARLNRIEHGADEHREDRDERVLLGGIGRAHRQRIDDGKARAARAHIAHEAQQPQRDEEQHGHGAVDVGIEQQKRHERHEHHLRAAPRARIAEDLGGQRGEQAHGAGAQQHVEHLHEQVDVHAGDQPQDGLQKETDRELIRICAEIGVAHRPVVAAGKELRGVHDVLAVDLLLQPDAHDPEQRGRQPDGAADAVEMHAGKAREQHLAPQQRGEHEERQRGIGQHGVVQEGDGLLIGAVDALEDGEPEGADGQRREERQQQNDRGRAAEARESLCGVCGGMLHVQPLWCAGIAQRGGSAARPADSVGHFVISDEITLSCQASKSVSTAS